jgi:CheY-like chemotaxis protein
MFTHTYSKANTTENHPSLTELDEKKKMASVVLKRVDLLIKSKEFQKALLETAQVKEIDPTNVYAFAFEERIKCLLAEETKRQRQISEDTPSKPNKDNQILIISGPTLQAESNKSHITNSIAIPTETLPHLQPPIESTSTQKSQIGHNGLAPIPTAKTIENKSEIKQKLKVLIIDDDASLLSVLSMTIESSGFEVISLSTSDEAYMLLNKFLPDIIICDINLETSTMGGFSFFEKVQQIERLRQVPFVFLTGLNDDVLIRTGKEMGADDYLTKPIREQDLLAVIRGKTKRFGEIRKMITTNNYTPAASMIFS